MPAVPPTDTEWPFQRLQRQFTAHLRDPENHPPPPGIAARRVAVYRDLLFDNVDRLLSNGFPVLRCISSDAAWRARVRRFLVEHACQTPYFSEIGREFVDWFVDESGIDADDPPFIGELAHYEWIEVAVAKSTAERELPAVDPNGDLLTGVPVLSPLAVPLCYRYPVHRIGPEYLPAAPPEEPSYLVVQRDRLDAVHFLEINAVTFRLLEILRGSDPMTGEQALGQIAIELDRDGDQALMAHGATLLDDLRQRDVISGTRR